MFYVDKCDSLVHGPSLPAKSHTMGINFRFTLRQCRDYPACGRSQGEARLDTSTGHNLMQLTSDPGALEPIFTFCFAQFLPFCVALERIDFRFVTRRRAPHT